MCGADGSTKFDSMHTQQQLKGIEVIGMIGSAPTAAASESNAAADSSERKIQQQEDTAGSSAIALDFDDDSLDQDEPRDRLHNSIQVLTYEVDALELQIDAVQQRPASSHKSAQAHSQPSPKARELQESEELALLYPELAHHPRCNAKHHSAQTRRGLT